MTLGSSGNTAPSTLRGLCRFLTNTQDNTSAFSDTDIDALLNNEYRDLQAYILSQVFYDWKENTVEGTGTGLVNLVNGTNSYSFPSSLIQIDRLELNYDASTNGWKRAIQLKQQSIEEGLANTSNGNAFRGTSSNPIYWMRNGKIYIDPIPTQSTTNGMKVYGTTLITDLSDAAHEPVFSKAFHEILAYGASYTWMLSRDHQKATSIVNRKEQMKQEMVLFYANRDTDTRLGFRPRTRSLT